MDKRAKNKLKWMTLLVLLGSFAISQFALAHPTGSHHVHSHEQRSMLISKAKQSKEKQSPKSRAADKARKSPDDKILKITDVKVKGKPMYKVKLITKDGRVKTVLVDGE